jgi:hypothetical protein
MMREDVAIRFLPATEHAAKRRRTAGFLDAVSVVSGFVRLCGGAGGIRTAALRPCPPCVFQFEVSQAPRLKPRD